MHITKGELMEILETSSLPDTAPVILRTFREDATQPADPKVARTGYWETRELVKVRRVTVDSRLVLSLQGEVI